MTIIDQTKLPNSTKLSFRPTVQQATKTAMKLTVGIRDLVTPTSINAKDALERNARRAAARRAVDKLLR